MLGERIFIELFAISLPTVPLLLVCKCSAASFCPLQTAKDFSATVTLDTANYCEVIVEEVSGVYRRDALRIAMQTTVPRRKIFQRICIRAIGRNSGFFFSRTVGIHHNEAHETKNPDFVPYGRPRSHIPGRHVGNGGNGQQNRT